jgi:uncharacterized protein YpmB
MRLEIEDKRKFVLSISFLVVIILVIVGSAYYFISTKSRQKDVARQKIDTREAKEKTEAQKSAEEKKVVAPVFSDYKNQKYGYSVSYPNNWYISSSEAEDELVKPDLESGMDYSFGGQVFWSNYANIDDFTPQDKPDDFRLLGLTIYQGDDETITDFSQKIGISEDSVEADFQTTGNLSGKQFIFTGLAGTDLQITVILKKDKLFYVFKTAFIDGDELAAEIMEKIISSFAFQS